MSSNQIKILITGILLFSISANVVSQTQSQKLPSIKLFSYPPGAYIELMGQYFIRGVTPITIPYQLKGEYKIVASKYGYETWSTYYNFDGESNREFTFNLTPKTRVKAGLRSLFFPGWGQYYSDRKFIGSLIALGELTSLIIAIKKNSDYENDSDEYNKLLNRYKKEKLPYEERKSLLNDVYKLEKKADKTYEKRQTWMYISATIWAYNVLDALVFFHFDKIISSKKFSKNFSFSPNRISLRVNF